MGKTWRYEVYEIEPMWWSTAGTQLKLNLLGDKGWELVQIIFEDGKKFAYFKKSYDDDE